MRSKLLIAIMHYIDTMATPLPPRHKNLRFEGLASLDEDVQMTAAELLLDAEHKVTLHKQQNKRSHDDLLALIDASELQGLLYQVC